VTLTKAKLAEKIQKSVWDVKPSEAPRLVERVVQIIKDTLAGGEDVLISGFGKFEVQRKHSRQGRNPQTGDSLTLRQRQVVVFKISSTLRRKLNPKPEELSPPARAWRRR